MIWFKFRVCNSTLVHKPFVINLHSTLISKGEHALEVWPTTDHLGLAVPGLTFIQTSGDNCKVASIVEATLPFLHWYMFPQIAPFWSLFYIGIRSRDYICPLTNILRWLRPIEKNSGLHRWSFYFYFRWKKYYTIRLKSMNPSHVGRMHLFICKIHSVRSNALFDWKLWSADKEKLRKEILSKRWDTMIVHENLDTESSPMKFDISCNLFLEVSGTYLTPFLKIAGIPVIVTRI